MKYSIVPICLCILVSVQQPGLNARDVPVRIESGLVTGTRTAAGKVRVFRGIPFAAPMTTMKCVA